MKKWKLLICDEDEIYCDRLRGYLMGKRQELFTFCVCSAKEDAIAYLTEPGADAALMTADFFTQEILSFPGVCFLLFCEGAAQEEFKNYPLIHKYQKAEGVLRALCAALGEKEDAQEAFFFPGIGRNAAFFYSPQQDGMQTQYAFGYAKYCAKKERTLYVNLSPCAGMEGMLKESYEETVGDFLFYLRRKEKNLKLRFAAMLHTFADVDYLPPVFFGEILSEATREDYENLFAWLFSETTYERIIFDVGVMFSGFFALLARCSEIYCLTQENPWAKNRYEQFLKCAGEYGDEALAARITPIRTTGFAASACGQGEFREAIWGMSANLWKRQRMGGGESVRADG